MTLAEALPSLLRHEGRWEGVYRHVARDGSLLDEHQMTTVCEFPREGHYAYIQHNHLRWTDGRERHRSFGGIYRDGRIWWDTERFHGFGWETLEGAIMLSLHRKDEPDTHFIETILLADDGATRARTWQWFERGAPTRRTLCDEWRP